MKGGGRRHTDYKDGTPKEKIELQQFCSKTSGLNWGLYKTINPKVQY